MARFLRIVPALIGLALLLTVCARPFYPPSPPPPRPTPQHPKPYRVHGVWYQPIPNARGFEQKGIASWYGRQFHGRKTSNGEIYDMYAMTAAHKTLPLPSYVEVTNLRNGKRIVVRVNDRGPFVDNRLIDLSYAAAGALDLVGPGTGLVEVRTVARPGSTAPTVAVANATVAPESFYIQVGAYAVAENAERVVGHLRREAFPGVLSRPKAVDGRNVHRVQVGPVGSVDEFDNLIYRLASLGYDEARLAFD